MEAARQPGTGVYGGEQIGLPRLREFGLRMRVWWSKDGLTRRLADGADSTESRELALRAGQLTAKQTRELVADSLDDLVGMSKRSRALFTSQAPFDRSKVRGARTELVALARRLRSPEPVRPQGMALALLLVTDPELPLFGSATKNSLARAIIGTSERLDAPPQEGWL
jgi:hypothetical protein